MNWKLALLALLGLGGGALLTHVAQAQPMAPPTPKPKPKQPKPVDVDAEASDVPTGYVELVNPELELERVANDIGAKLNDSPGTLYPFEYDGVLFAALVRPGGKVVILQRISTPTAD